MNDTKSNENSRKAWNSFINPPSNDNDSVSDHPNVKPEHTSWGSGINSPSKNNGKDDKTPDDVWSVFTVAADRQETPDKTRSAIDRDTQGFTKETYSNTDRKSTAVRNDKKTEKKYTDAAKDYDINSDPFFAKAEDWEPSIPVTPEKPKKYEGSKTSGSSAPVDTKDKRPITPEPVRPGMPHEPDIPTKSHSYSSSGNNPGTGMVRGFQSLSKDEIPGNLARWMRSVFSGVPYSGDQTGSTFILCPDSFGEDGSCQVIIYGTITEGKPFNTCKVRLKGKRLSSGVFVMTSGQLLLDPPVDIRVKNQISAGMVRFLTLFAVICLMIAGRMIYSLISYITSNSNAIGSFLVELLVNGLLIFIIFYGLWRQIRSFFRRR